MIVPDRLIAAIRRKGISQAALGRSTGLSSSMINKLARGEARESAHIYAIARALDVTPEYLSGDAEDPGMALQPQEAQAGEFLPVPEVDEDDEIVEVKELDLAFGMGGGSYLDLPVRSKPRKFTRGWLRMFTMSPPARIFIARGIGDSMSPTIMNADIVIIDTADNRVNMGDQIWAISYGETGLIKRLRPMADGSVKILSDNANVPPEIAYDGEMHVVGKVVAVVRKMAG